MKKIIILVFILGLCVGNITTAIINEKIVLKKEIKKIENKANANNEALKKEMESKLKQNSTTKPPEDKPNPITEEEYVNIKIESGYNSNDVANLLYDNKLISNVEDFKFIYTLMKIDIYKGGEILTNKGIISKGWKIDSLLGVLKSKQNKISSLFYENGLIDDRKNFSNFLNVLDGPKYIISGEKKIKKGSSMIEIVNIITSN